MGGIPLRTTLCLLLLIAVSGGVHGCRSPAPSTLPPAALALSGTPLPPLPKGDLYAEETVVSADAPIEPGDTLEVVIRRGAGEEKYTSLVSEAGTAAISFLEVDVEGLTAAEADALIQEAVQPYMKNPPVQVGPREEVAPNEEAGGGRTRNLSLDENDIVYVPRCNNTRAWILTVNAVRSNARCP